MLLQLKTNGIAMNPGRAVPRLLPHVVDEIAATESSKPYLYQPQSDKAQDGWVPVTFKELSNAINHIACMISQTIKKGSSDDFPTLGYIGPSDVRYGVLVLAAVKAGCKTLLVSPRNSLEAQLALFEKTDCHHIWYAKPFEAVVQSWLCERKMKSYLVPHAQELLQTISPPFPYTKSFDEGRQDPLVVLHTSGSTGMPKPVVIKQGSLAILDTFRGLPNHMGAIFAWKFWQASATRVFVPLPLFHAAGLLAGILGLSIYYGVPVALPITSRPLTADLILQCFQHAGADATFLVPSIIEELSSMSDGMDAMKKLAFVAFAGGSLSPAVGDRLVEAGIVLNNCIASTEFLPYAVYCQPNPKLWQYFIFNTEVIGAQWRPFDAENGIYELAVRRKDPKEPLDQPIFYTFPELSDWSTGDLFKAHPTLKDHWLYYGRSDNVIVFSNGEKLNPVTIEEALVGHPSLKGALVVGQNRFQPALILEPITIPKTREESLTIIDTVWPLIEEVNKETVAHGRITKRLIAISDPDIPFPRASKGTVQRGLALRAYKLRIDEIYRQLDLVDAAHAIPLNLATVDAATQSIMKMLTQRVGVESIEPDTDFLSAGIDSLQVLSISKLLRTDLAASGIKVPDALVAPRAIYVNSTAKKLASHLIAITNTTGGQEIEDDITTLESLVAKYTEHLPAPRPGKPKPLEEGQTIILTGSTGSLGAYLLDLLCKSHHVKSIITLNRDVDGGRSRQPGLSATRGLGADFSKVEFLSADLSQSDLGLGPIKYKEMLLSADRIIHNAWPVNFNISLSSFEPYIRGVRNLVDFSSVASKQVPIIFLSSISTIGNWRSTEIVPECRLSDPSLAQMGYGLSKLAGSLILDAASDVSKVPGASIRIGQIAGPRGLFGQWNPHEFLPSLVGSSVFLGCLPKDLNSHDAVDWMPIEDVARLTLDVCGITQTKDVSEITGYFHCVNPSVAKWTDLSIAIKEFYDGRIKDLVSLEDWVAALDSSAVNVANIEKNPAIKLLDTYKLLLEANRAGNGRVRLDMERTISQSHTAATVGPITTQMMKEWCKQWNF